MAGARDNDTLYKIIDDLATGADLIEDVFDGVYGRGGPFEPPHGEPPCDEAMKVRATLDTLDDAREALEDLVALSTLDEDTDAG
jgi:hypothetical protein